MKEYQILIILFTVISILAFVSGLSKAIMDTLVFHYDVSVFKLSKHQNWWNPLLSWNNKNTMSKNVFITYLLRNSLVALTDAWHLFSLINFYSLIGIILVVLFIPDGIMKWWSSLILVAAIAAIRTVIFHIYFTHIFKKK